MSSTIDCPKCKHEHDACGSHEEDEGKWECEECGFKFEVEIEYDPDYSTSCVEHEFDDYFCSKINGKMLECCFCIHCNYCKILNKGCEPL